MTVDDPRHGTRNGYNNLGCRCERCREAQRVYIFDQSHRVGRHRPLAVENAFRHAAALARDNHGTETRYALGCRCDACRAGSAAGRKRRRHAAA